MDWSFVETEYEDAPDAIFSDRQKLEEKLQLEDLANKVGSYRWSYKPEFQVSENVDGEEHIGPTAQQLQTVPGLESAVFTDEQGNLKIDTNYLSLATIGLVAALARIVLKGEDIHATNQELPTRTSEVTEQAGENIEPEPSTESGTGSGEEQGGFPIEQNNFPVQTSE